MSVKKTKRGTVGVRRELTLPSIAYVVARSKPGNVIGCENALPWHLKTDLAHFRAVTADHVVIMGRRTHESIGRVLPRRINIVVSRSPVNEMPGLLWAKDRETALFLADHFSIKSGLDTIFVVGGEEIYRLFKDVFNKVYLTEVYAPDVHGDAHFAHKFDRRRWAESGREHHDRSLNDDYDFDFVVYERRRAWVRQTELSVFLKQEAEVLSGMTDIKYAEVSAVTRRQAHKLDTLAAELESAKRRLRLSKASVYA
jgi:dihydrofolate reductase